MPKYEHFNPEQINTGKSIYVPFSTKNGDTKKLPARCRGEKVSDETYKVYVDTIFKTVHPTIEFNEVEKKGDLMVCHIHKEDIYVEK